MFRRLLISATCTALLAGCMSTGYSYRADRGDYYYGQPRVEYRQYGGYDDGFGWPGYYGPYRGGYPGYGASRFSFGLGYGHPGLYGRYGSGFGGYPYYGRHPYYGRNPYYGGHPYYDTRPRYRHRNPRPYTGYQPRPDAGDARDGSPWRNLDDVRRRQADPTGPRIEPAMRNEPRATRGTRDGSSLGDMIRQSRETQGRDNVGVSEQEP